MLVGETGQTWEGLQRSESPRLALFLIMLILFHSIHLQADSGFRIGSGQEKKSK